MAHLPGSPETIFALALAVLGALTLAGFVLLLLLFREVRRLRRAHDEWAKHIDKAVSETSPTRAAIAAVLATSSDKSLTMEQFESEMAALMDQWEDVETLAEKAHAQLAELLEGDSSERN